MFFLYFGAAVGAVISGGFDPAAISQAADSSTSNVNDSDLTPEEAHALWEAGESVFIDKTATAGIHEDRAFLHGIKEGGIYEVFRARPGCQVHADHIRAACQFEWIRTPLDTEFFRSFIRQTA